MKKEIRVNNLVKFFIILLLNEGPKHGYEIIKDIERKIGKKPSASQIYPFLSKLKKYNYIIVKEHGEKDKKIFILTSLGKKFVKQMMNRFGGLIEIAIEPKITSCAHCNCKIYSGGYKERINNKNLTFCCEHCAASFKKYH